MIVFIYVMLLPSVHSIAYIISTHVFAWDTRTLLVMQRNEGLSIPLVPGLGEQWNMHTNQSPADRGGHTHICCGSH